MTMKTRLTAMLAVWALLPLAALEITECRPAEGGKTLVAWKDAPGKYVMVYRYSERITPQNIFFAVRQRFDAADGSCLIAPKSDGESYYLVTACDQFGKETRDFSLQRGPVKECAAAPLAAIRFRVRSGEQGTSLIWDPLPLAYRGMIRKILLKNRSGKVVGENSPSATEFILPPVRRGEAEEYTVVAQGLDGRDSAAERFFRYGDFPDFTISPESNVVKNEDVFLQTRYPVVGRRNRIRLRIANCGGGAGTAKVEMPGIIAAEISLKAGGSAEVSGEWQPERCGRYLLPVTIVCAEDRQKENNRLDLVLHAVDKPTFFLWYGRAGELNYSTAGTDAPEHWKRLGGKRLHICVKSASPEGYFKILASPDAPDGLQYDELGGDIPPAAYLVALRELRKRYPGTFIALWHIGAKPAPEIVEALKDGTIDLIMPERYHTYDAPMEESLKKDIAHLRALGILDKTIFGLGTHRNYAGFGNTVQHAGYLERQIALIRRLAPESPGLAFYNDYTLPGLKEKVDELCRRYFLEPPSGQPGGDRDESSTK